MKNILFILATTGILLGQGNFTFAHISDTHIGNATAAEDLQRTVSDINSLNGVSFVLVTGDITEAGFDDQLRIAKQILDGLSVPWYIIPGNHDMKWSGSGGYSFQKIFGYERITFEKEGYKFIGMHQGPVLKMGDGHWSPQDISWLDSVLASTDLAHPIIFFTHYPLDEGIANWYAATEKLKRRNIVAALYGHGHRNRFDNAEGIHGVMGRSNLRAKDSVGGYNIVEIRHDTMFYSERKPGILQQKNWLAFPLKKNESLGEGAVRPHYAVNDSFPNIKTKWKYRSGYTIASTPAEWNENIIFGDASGKIIAIDRKSGKNKWKFTTKGPVYSTPAVEKDYVVFSSTDSNIYCLNAKNGSLRWKYKTDASVVASPIIRSGAVFIGASDGKFRGIDIENGSLLWEYNGIGGFVECVPAFAEGKIIFGAWDEHLYCLDAGNGELMWKWRSDRKGTLLSPAACEPVIANGKVFIVAPDRFMTAIDIQTGKTVWRTNQFQVRETMGISDDTKRIYIRTMNDSLYAVSSEMDHPKVVWSLNAQFGYDINSAMIKEKSGTIYYPTKNGLVLAIDGKNGNLIWKHKTGVGVTNTLLPLDGKNIIVTDFDGTVSMIGLVQ